MEIVTEVRTTGLTEEFPHIEVVWRDIFGQERVERHTAFDNVEYGRLIEHYNDLLTYYKTGNVKHD